MAHETTRWVHQYSLRDLVDDTFDLFKERVTSLLLVGVIPYSLVVIYVFLMRTFVIPENFLQRLDWDAFVAVLQAPKVWLFLLGLGAVNAVAFTVAHVAQCRVAVAHALGDEISLGRAYRLLAKPFWSLVVFLLIFTPLASIISSVTTSVGAVVGALLGVVVLAIGGGQAGAAVAGVLAMVCTVAGGMVGTVLVATCFISVPMLTAHEHLGPFAAMGRAYRIANANYKSHLIALYVLMHVPTFFWPISILVTAWLIGLVNFISPTLNVMITSLIGTLLSVAILGLAACFEALIYLDGRCRLEALDLLVLAKQIGLGEELERALRQGPAAVAAQFPDYSALPAAPVAPAGGGALLTPPAAPAGFPDYSAPPPPEVTDGE